MRDAKNKIVQILEISTNKVMYRFKTYSSDLNNKTCI